MLCAVSRHLQHIITFSRADSVTTSITQYTMRDRNNNLQTPPINSHWLASISEQNLGVGV